MTIFAWLPAKKSALSKEQQTCRGPEGLNSAAYDPEEIAAALPYSAVGSQITRSRVRSRSRVHRCVEEYLLQRN
jgi:hypothetical protein